MIIIPMKFTVIYQVFPNGTHPNLASLCAEHVENFVIHAQPDGLKYQASN